MAEGDYKTTGGVQTGAVASNDLWPDFGVPTMQLADQTSTVCDAVGSLADAVLNEFGIPGGGGGGSLQDLDIKRMDAMTVLNLSLIEQGAAAGAFIEPMVNAAGDVEYVKIDSSSGNISDIYFSISTGSFVDSVKGVMVTGGRPLPELLTMTWTPIWGDNPANIYTAQNMYSNCRKQDFIRNASIVFNDPQLSSAFDDGIDNLYEINSTNPWDRIVGYAKYINPGDSATSDTTIDYTNSASVPLKVGEGSDLGPEMGTLAERPNFSASLYNPDCYVGAGTEVSYEGGVKVEIPEDLRYDNRRGVRKDKFVKISNVYLVGKRIQTMSIGPKDAAAAKKLPTKENAILYISIDDSDTTTTKLDEGKHYSLAYQSTGTGQTPYIVFAKDTLAGDPFAYGQGQKVTVDPRCTFAQQNGYLEPTEIEATIFPHTNYKGIMVFEIWVTVDLETPAIVIYDPGNPEEDEGGHALQVAQELEYYLGPIVIREPPAPIAYANSAGSATAVDQTPTQDNDPTTSQDIGDSELEGYMDEMQGGGMAITWSFLDADGAGRMASMLYKHLANDVVETIYTCGPNCNPKLGGKGYADGVVNSIRYSYTDSGSYTVSVTEGPTLIGNLTPIDGGPSMKMAENFSSGGTVIATAGDNLHFKVRIDGYGERWAVNMAPTVLRMGDVVQCTVHNNPVES